jgi:hypothetical protein
MSQVYGRYLYGGGMVHPTMYATQRTFESMSSGGRHGLQPACLDYIHYVALYEPHRNIQDLFTTLWNATGEVVNECALETDAGLRKVAANRGMSVQDVKREFRDLKKQFPNAVQIQRMGLSGTIPTMMAAYQRALPSTLEGQRWIAASQGRSRTIV